MGPQTPQARPVPPAPQVPHARRVAPSREDIEIMSDDFAETQILYQDLWTMDMDWTRGFIRGLQRRIRIFKMGLDGAQSARDRHRIQCWIQGFKNILVDALIYLNAKVSLEEMWYGGSCECKKSEEGGK